MLKALEKLSSDAASALANLVHNTDIQSSLLSSNTLMPLWKVLASSDSTSILAYTMAILSRIHKHKDTSESITEHCEYIVSALTRCLRHDLEAVRLSAASLLLHLSESYTQKVVTAESTPDAVKALCKSIQSHSEKIETKVEKYAIRTLYHLCGHSFQLDELMRSSLLTLHVTAFKYLTCYQQGYWRYFATLILRLGPQVSTPFSPFVHMTADLLEQESTPEMALLYVKFMAKSAADSDFAPYLLAAGNTGYGELVKLTKSTSHTHNPIGIFI